MSTISASTTSTTAFKITTDTTGALVFQTGASPTTAMTLGSDQSVTFAGTPTYSGGTANGVAYLNGSKVLTTGTALVFDGNNLGLGVTPSTTAGAWKALELVNAGNCLVGGYGEIDLANNLKYDRVGSFSYVNTGYASRFVQSGGVFTWHSGTGTAGAVASLTQAMTLNTSGNLGVGVTSIASDAKVHVGGALRAGSTTYNASPASTLFSNTLAAASGSTRVVNFDGNGLAPSVWWTNGSRAYSAIDADGTNNLAFWANNGTTWQKQVNVNYGSVDLLYTVNATGGVMTVTNPSGSSYNENLRLPRASGTYTSVCLATDPAASSGTIDGQFTILVCPSSVNSGQFSIRHHNTDVLTVQKSGYIGTPLNPAFQAQGDSAAVLSTAGWQKVPYSQSVTQRGTGYSSANSRFTAPIAGWYQFNAQWSANDNGDTDGTFTFAINGDPNANKGTVSMPNTGGAYDGHTMAATIYMAANDYVEVYRYSTVSTTTRSNYWQGWFSGHFIG